MPTDREPDDPMNLGGWGPKAWDQLRADVDYVLSVLRGKPTDKPEGDPRILGVGLGTWIALLATVVVPLVGTAALVVLHNP